MWSDFITSVQCLQKLSLMMIGNICVGENKRAGRDGAHQLYTLLHINSFSCVGISPQIDWFYLPALVGRVWKWEKKCFKFIYYIVFLLQLTLCKASGFFSLLPCTCTWSVRLLPLTSLQRNPNPRSHVSMLWLFWGAGCEGRRVPTRIPQLPPSSSNLGSRRNPPIFCDS